MKLIDRLERIRGRVETACQHCGRRSDEITLLGATKSATAEKVREAFDAGLHLFGENRVQEGRAKIDALEDLPATWHFIGRLQKNKAGQAIDLFDTIQSVDSISLAERIERVATGAEEIVPVFLEVNVGDEISKGGVSLPDAESACARISELEHLRLTGIMSIPPYNPDPEKVRPYFRKLRTLFDHLSASYRSIQELSMGMSEDFEVAVEEGATLIRLGRILFGERY